MARTILIAAAVAWLLAGIVGLGLAAMGTDWLRSRLPPLAIDVEALGGALTAMALGLIVLSGAHIAVVAGLRRERRWACSAGVLLALVLAAASFGLAAAAISSAAREAGYALPLISSAVLATLGTAGYALVAAQLARELGSESAS